MDPSGMSRRALQKMAKRNGVRANSKTEILIEELTKRGLLSCKRRMTGVVLDLTDCTKCKCTMTGDIYQVGQSSVPVLPDIYFTPIIHFHTQTCTQHNTVNTTHPYTIV